MALPSPKISSPRDRWQNEIREASAQVHIVQEVGDVEDGRAPHGFADAERRPCLAHYPDIERQFAEAAAVEQAAFHRAEIADGDEEADCPAPGADGLELRIQGQA